MKNANAEVLLRVFGLYDKINKLSSDNDLLAIKYNNLYKQKEELEAENERLKELVKKLRERGQK